MADSFRGRLAGLFHPEFELAVVFGLVVVALRLGDQPVGVDRPRLVVADPNAVSCSAQSKFDLPFALLADPGHSTAEAYGVWVEKSTDGTKCMGVERSTFVIDADGTVVKVMRKVKPETHADDVLAALGS